MTLLARGSGNRQIVREVGISETSVKSEFRFKYADLEAGNHAQATAVVLRIGLSIGNPVVPLTIWSTLRGPLQVILLYPALVMRKTITLGYGPADQAPKAE